MINQKILKRVKRELKRIKPSFELEYVCHLNNLKTDQYLYLVIAEDTKPHSSIPGGYRYGDYRYIVYTYNDSLQSMNHGHYNITLTSALELILNKRKEFEENE